MTEQKRAPWLQPSVDYGPILVFFVVYVLRDLMAATAAVIVASALALGIAFALERRVPPMPLITAVVVAVFGGLTLWLQDATFIKMKPTIVQGLIAALLLGGVATGRPLLKPLLGPALPPMRTEAWHQLSLRYGLFFAAMAGLNEIVWRTQSTDVWVTFKVFGILALTLLFGLLQVPLLSRNRLAEEGEGANG